MIKSLCKHPIITLILRIAVVYILLGVLRAIFYIENQESLGALTWSEIPELLRGAWVFDTANVCYTFGLFIVFSLLPLSLKTLKKKWYNTTSFILYAMGATAVVVLNISDSVYFHFAKKRFTSGEFEYTDNGNNMAIIWQATKENWGLALMALALLGLTLWCYHKLKPQYTKSRHIALHYGLRTTALALAIFLIITGMRGGIGRSIRPITLSNAAQYANSPSKASLILSNPFCMLRTIENKSIRYQKYFTQSELDSLCSPLRLPATDSLSGSQKGKNVVIIILESFSAEHSRLLNPSLYPDGNGPMPFVDSLMGESYYFRQAYANGHKSIEAMPSILASIPSFKTPFATLPAALSPMDGLGKLLGKEGYSTWFFNGSQMSSMGYVAAARLSGIENFRTKENYEAARGKNDFDGYWGIWDEPFLNYFAHELSDVQQPFMASLFTLSSHHPFIVPEQYQGLPQGKTKIHKPVSYTDIALRHFFDYAKTQPWYKNTIFVLVADHVSSETFAPQTLTPTGHSHIMQFIYTPDGSLKGSSSKTTQQIDITPTLLGLLGYEKSFFAFGRDFFDDQQGFAINYSDEFFQWITDSHTYFFDEQQITHTYDNVADPLQQHNIANQADSVVLKQVKAFVQRYYQSLEEGNFTVQQ